MEIKKDDWCIYELKIVQIMATAPYVEYSDGHVRGSGVRASDFRPLTLQNKVIIEGMDYYYEMLRAMDGSAGFNFPDIHRYFSMRAREAIDGNETQAASAFKKAQDFVHAARDYQKVIDGVHLFRPR